MLNGDPSLNQKGIIQKSKEEKILIVNQNLKAIKIIEFQKKCLVRLT